MIHQYWTQHILSWVEPLPCRNPLKCDPPWIKKITLIHQSNCCMNKKICTKEIPLTEELQHITQEKARVYWLSASRSWQCVDILIDTNTMKNMLLHSLGSRCVPYYTEFSSDFILQITAWKNTTLTPFHISNNYCKHTAFKCKLLSEINQFYKSYQTFCDGHSQGGVSGVAAPSNRLQGVPKLIL